MSGHNGIHPNARLRGCFLHTAGEGELALGELAPHPFPSIVGEGSGSNGHNGAAQHSKRTKLLRQPPPIQKCGSQRAQVPPFHDNPPNCAPPDWPFPKARKSEKRTYRLTQQHIAQSERCVGVRLRNARAHRGNARPDAQGGGGGHWCEMRRGDRPRVRCCGPVNTPATLTLGAIRADPVTRETICTGQRAPEARRSEWWQICGLVEGRPGGSERGAARAASAGCADGGLATVGGGSV